MKENSLTSIVISSYNYGCFLREAIDSALGQTYTNTEVIVVDDASTDDSPEIIAGYGDRISSVLRRKNEGGNATYNEACRVSRGEIVLILDSDDKLDPAAVERVVVLFRDPGVVKVHWPLREIDAQGALTGKIVPDRPLPDGDLRAVVTSDGPCGCANPPTSGNAWSRGFLERVLPVPPEVYCDAYLSGLACASGTIRSISEPQGYYRVHGLNEYSTKAFEEKLRRDLVHYDRCCTALSDHCRDLGIHVDVGSLKARSWYHRRHLAAQELRALIPNGESFILADEDNWATGGAIEGCRAIPFPERKGRYWGPPPDDESAIGELERLRRAGAGFIAFAWPAFWWLDYYADLSRHLRSRFRCLLENDRLVVFDLRRPNDVELEEALAVYTVQSNDT